MKPTVITNSSGSGGNGGNGNTGPAPNTPSGGQNPHHANVSYNNNTNNPNNDGNNQNYGGGSGGGSRQHFPHFFQGFGFEPDMDEMFSDAGIRSRLGRMPFGFGSRKRLNDPNRYFDDDNDFFSNFGSLGRRRPSQPQSDRTGIFDHIPPEFRQYMPDTFDFPSTVRNTPPSPRSAGVQPQYPPQFHETYAQTGPGSPTANQPQAQKPKLCDAAIQTENPPDDGTDQSNKTHKVQPLKQHGMRNTVDLGQKSPPENEQFSRAQSAPPNDATEQNFETSTASTSAQTSNPNNNYTSSTAYAYVPPPEQQRYHAAQQTSPPHPQQRPPAPHPPPRSHSQQQYYQQPTQPQPQQSNPQGGAYVRTVPIFVEGRSEPVINEQKYTPPESQPTNQYQQQHSPPQYRSHKEFRPQQPQPQPQQQQHQQPQFQQPHQEQYQPYQQHQQNQQHYQPQEHHHQNRPTPLNTQQANTAPAQHGPIPSTPQTTATIEKIQLIQRDVLNLMSKVEKFAGIKNAKEYMYLDEMLTRNLLKLDTIDTQGKERIRLARKEAIKCIQASINVLEAKAEENAKTAKKSVMNDSQEISTNTEQLEQQNTTNDENSNINSVPATIDEASTAKLPDVVPLPPPPERPSKDNQKSNDNEKCSEQMNNQEIKDQSAEQIKEQTINETNKEEKTTNIEQKTDESIAPCNVPDPVPTADETTTSTAEQNKKDEKQKSPTKEERSKESPKKKIIKRIIKKLDKKDKKGSGTPPSTEQQEASSEAPPVTEVTN